MSSKFQFTPVFVGRHLNIQAAGFYLRCAGCGFETAFFFGSAKAWDIAKAELDHRTASDCPEMFPGLPTAVTSVVNRDRGTVTTVQGIGGEVTRRTENLEDVRGGRSCSPHEWTDDGVRETCGVCHEIRYPESEKLAKRDVERAAMHELLRFLEAQSMIVARWEDEPLYNHALRRVYASNEDLVLGALGIDQKRLERERQRMIRTNALRANQTKEK